MKKTVKITREMIMNINKAKELYFNSNIDIQKYEKMIAKAKILGMCLEVTDNLLLIEDAKTLTFVSPYQIVLDETKHYTEFDTGCFHDVDVPVGLFRDTEFEAIYFDGVDTSEDKDMESMFNGCKAKYIDCSSFVVGRDINIYHMFRMCNATIKKSKSLYSELDSDNVALLDRNIVEQIRKQGRDKSLSFKSGVDKSILKMEALSNNKRAYDIDDKFTVIEGEDSICLVSDLQIVLDNVDRFTYVGIFENTEFYAIDFAGVDTSNTRSMKNLFHNSIIKRLDLSSFDTSRVEDMDSMFANTHKLEDLDISNFSISEDTKIYYIWGYRNRVLNVKVTDKRLIESFDRAEGLKGMYVIKK